MDPNDEESFHQLLSQALELEAEERDAYLSAACGDDGELRRALERALEPTDAEVEASLEAWWIAGDPAGSPQPAASRSVVPTTAGSAMPSTSLFRRLRGARGFALFAAMAAGLPLLLGAAILGAVSYLDGADPDFVFGALSGRINSAGERWQGLHPGDSIVAIEGRIVDVDPARIRSALLTLEPGPTALRVRRGGEELTFSAILEPFSPTRRAVLWSRVLTGGLLFAIGLAAFVLRPDSPAAWRFFLFCASLGGHLLTFLALLPWPRQGLLLESLGLYLAAATGLHLFASYPRPLLRRPAWALLFYLPPAAAALAMVALPLTPASFGALAKVVTTSQTAAAAGALGSIAFALLQLRAARRRGDAIDEARGRAISAALVFGLAVPALLGVVPLFQGALHWASNSFLVIVFAVLTAYSMVRHNALDVDRFTAAVVGYSATTLVLALAFAGLVVGVPALAGGSGWITSPVVAAVLTGTFFLAFQPLYRRLRAGTDRLFFETVEPQLAAIDGGWQRTESLGAYRLRGRLGTGGMAEVLLADKQGPGGFARRVALKRILPHLSHDPDSIAMFLDEARIAAQLHHPNVVQIYEVESCDQSYYLTMELMDGPSLDAWLRRARELGVALPLPIVAKVASALLDALGYAHGENDRAGRPLGLVHRDVKPANLLTNRQGEVKLADFGIATATFRLHQTQGLGIRGTVPYMAPELLAGAAASPRSDLFAAGAVVFEMITLRRAFPEGAGAGRDLRLPAGLSAERRRGLGGFFARACHVRPEERFAGAAEMRTAFFEALGGIGAAPREEVAAHLARLGAPGPEPRADGGEPPLATPVAPDFQPTWISPGAAPRKLERSLPS